MRIEPARRSDLPGIRWLLEFERLPSNDLSERSLEHFLACRDEIGVVAAVGLDPCGGVVLLRSLVVALDYRRQGLADRLIKSAEATCGRLSWRPIYLLTTSAERYFAARGYSSIDRPEAPPEIASSVQFTSLCPSTAILMRKP